MFKAQNALEGVISNFPNRFIAAAVKRIVFPLGRPYVVPSDRLGHQVARILIEPSATRDRLTAGMYIDARASDPVREMELALDATVAVEPIEEKLRVAAKKGRLAAKLPPGAGPEVFDARAVEAGVITADEARLLAEHRALTASVVRVDDFGPDLGTSLLVPTQPVTVHAAKVRQPQPAARTVGERAAA
jgi:acyl-CoA dehydrogenase